MKDTNKYQDDRYFRIGSLYAACFLYCKNQALVNISRTSNSKRAEFVFVNSPEIEILLHEFNYAKEDASAVSIDVRKFVTAIKQLKDKLYQEVAL